jgi:serine/threonine protein kinase
MMKVLQCIDYSVTLFQWVMPIKALVISKTSCSLLFAFGTPLTEVMSNKDFNSTKAFSITQQILTCLLHFGNKGVVHNDVKPQNIVLDNWNAKFIDLDEARPCPFGETARERLPITKLFASPERFNDNFSISVRYIN